jgi:arsenate reductase
VASKSKRHNREVARGASLLITPGEACPAYLGKAVRGHWGLSDPGHVKGTEEEVIAAFEATYAVLENRIHELLALPVESMSRPELSEALNKIGAETH